MQRTVSRTDAHNRDGGANVAAVKAVQQTTVNENNGDISVQQVGSNVVQWHRPVSHARTNARTHTHTHLTALFPGLPE